MISNIFSCQGKIELNFILLIWRNKNVGINLQTWLFPGLQKQKQTLWQ